MKEVAERFGIGFFEPSAFQRVVEELMVSDIPANAIGFPPLPRTFESTVGVVVGGDSHQFVTYIHEVDYHFFFAHRLNVVLRLRMSRA